VASVDGTSTRHWLRKRRQSGHSRPAAPGRSRRYPRSASMPLESYNCFSQFRSASQLALIDPEPK